MKPDTRTATRTTGDADDNRAAAADDDIGPVLPVLLLIALVPVTLGSVLWTSTPGGDGNPSLRVAVTVADAALLAVVVVATRRRDGWARPQLVGWLGVSLAATLTIALAVHPSPLGLNYALRVVGVLATGAVVARLTGRNRTLLLGTLLAVGAGQAVLAITQSVRGAAWGVEGLELQGPLYAFGSSHAGRGGFNHPYHLASFLLLAIAGGALGVRRSPRPALWLAGLTVCGAGIGVTYGRAALLGLGSVLLVLVVTSLRRREPVWGLAAAALVLGLAGAALLLGDGWLARAATTADVERIDSDRGGRADEAIRLVRDQPLTGVGPGRYVLTIAETQDGFPLPAHNIVLHEAAEGGVVTGALTLAALVALGRRTWRSGADGLLVLLPWVPFLLLDAYPYSFADGLALTGIWLGLLHFTHRRSVGGDKSPRIDVSPRPSARASGP